MKSLDELVSRYRAGENPLKAERRVELVALALLLLLILQIAFGLVSLVRASSVAPVLPSQDVLTVSRLEQVVRVKADARNEIVSRPLFWPGRSPVVAAEVLVTQPNTAKVVEQKLKGVRVVGIYGSGTSGGAILHVKKAKLRVAIGGEVEGWKLEAVGPGSARFVKDAAIEELKLQMVDASQIVKVVPSAPKQKPTNAKDTSPSTKGSLSLGGIR
ncbi:MAG: hypothetical protein ABJ084_15600 [Halioglobus sp.]